MTMNTLNFATVQAQSAKSQNSGQAIGGFGSAFQKQGQINLGFFELLLSANLSGQNGQTQKAVVAGSNDVQQGDQNLISQVLAGANIKGDGIEFVQQSQSGFPQEALAPEFTQLFSASPEILEILQKYNVAAGDSLEETLVLNQQAINQVLQPLDLKLSDFNNLKDLQDAIVAKLQQPEIFSKLNLTPAQVTTLKEKLASLQTQEGQAQTKFANADGAQSTKDLTQTDSKEERDALNNILSLLYELVPARNPEIAASVSVSVNTANARALTPASSESKGDTSSKSGQPNPLLGQKSPYSLSQFLNDMEVGEKGFEITKKGAALKGADNAASKITPQAGQNNSNGALALNFSNMLNSALGALGLESLSGLNWGQSSMDEYAMAPLSANPSSAQSLSNLITLNQGATQANPATQMIAATIQKGAADGKSRALTLQLDPPELGRVEVRMEFNKGKEFKTKIIAEKPETYLMLQRDSGALERALQDSGLDVDAGGLSFELADEGYNFSQNGGHDHQGPHGKGQGSSDEEEELLIESTMTWHVDPESGHMRYNILA